MDGSAVCGPKRDNKFSLSLVCWKGMLYTTVDDNDISRKSWAKGICIDVHSSNNDETNEQGLDARRGWRRNLWSPYDLRSTLFLESQSPVALQDRSPRIIIACCISWHSNNIFMKKKAWQPITIMSLRSFAPMRDDMPDIPRRRQIYMCDYRKTSPFVTMIQNCRFVHLTFVSRADFAHALPITHLAWPH